MLALAGFGLGQAYEMVKDYVNPVATGVFGLIVAVYVYRVVVFNHRRP